LEDCSGTKKQRRSGFTPERFMDATGGWKSFQVQGVKEDCSGTKIGGLRG